MSETLVIGIPTKDEYMVGRTIGDICATAMIMDRVPTFAYGVGSNICAGRDYILKLTKEIVGKDSCRMLWLDSDIWIKTPPAQLAKYMQEADENEYNIVAPYRRTDSKSSINRVDGRPFEWSELEGIEQYDVVKWAGMGFYYGYTPLNYKFYMSGEISEDCNFFVDNKIELRVDKRIVLYHNKRVFI